MQDSFAAEYEVVTNGSGFAPLGKWTTVRVAGADRGSFLHNMCTADVRSLVAGRGTEAFFTDVKGKIVAHALVAAGDQDHWLVGAPGQAERLMAHLNRYIIREDVQLADQTSELAWTAIAGLHSSAAVERLASQPGVAPAAPWAHGVARIGDVDVRLVRCPWLWPGGFLAACTTAKVERFRGELPSVGVAPASDAVWSAVRVESGWPLMDVDFDGTNLPQEIGRDAAAINFRKGCYLGQETVARIDALGHVNRRLATVRLSGERPPAAGAELEADGQSVGRVTSACWSPRLDAPLALAMVRRGHNDPGALLACGGVMAEVIPTPAVAHTVDAK